MAKQEIKLNKQVFGKISYPKVIDTEFKQLVKPEEVLTIDEPLTIPEFFAEYDKLFHYEFHDTLIQPEYIL